MLLKKQIMKKKYQILNLKCLMHSEDVLHLKK